MFSGIQRLDLLQRTSDVITSALPALVFPRLRLARSYTQSPTSWIGDRLLGLIIAAWIFFSAPALAALLMAALTTFWHRYSALIDYLIDSGLGPGVWGIKLNAALVGSVGRLWRDYTPLLANVLPPAHSPVWLSVRALA